MTNYLHSITSLSTDTIFILLVIGFVFFLGLRLGRGYIVSALLSLYLSAFIYSYATFTKTLTAIKGSGGLFWNHAGILLLIFVPINFILGKVISTDFGRGPIRFIRAGILALVFTGFLLSLLYHIIPLEPVYNLSPFIDRLFASDFAFTLWLITPLVVLFF